MQLSVLVKACDWVVYLNLYHGSWRHATNANVPAAIHRWERSQLTRPTPTNPAVSEELIGPQLVVLSQEPIWRWADCGSNHPRVYNSNGSDISSDLFPPWGNSALHLVLHSWLPIPLDCTLFAETFGSINWICRLGFHLNGYWDSLHFWQKQSLYDIVFPSIAALKGTGKHSLDYVQPWVENLGRISGPHYSARKRMGSALKLIWRRNVKNNVWHKLDTAPGISRQVLTAAATQPTPRHGIFAPSLATVDMHPPDSDILKYCLQFAFVKMISITNVWSNCGVTLVWPRRYRGRIYWCTGVRMQNSATWRFGRAVESQCVGGMQLSPM